MTKIPKGEYLPNATCVECRGLCCKTLPGVLLPFDIDPLTTEKIAELLRTGLYCIDWWEDYSPDGEAGYYLRPNTIFHFDPEKIDPYIPGWGGRCVFLNDDGCRLDFKDRPWNCRAMEPAADMDGTCNVPGVGKRSAKLIAAREWEPHWDLLHKAAEKVKGEK